MFQRGGGAKSVSVPRSHLISSAEELESVHDILAA
jgi:hypothetical protein